LIGASVVTQNVDDEVDEILDAVTDDLTLVLSYRYTYRTKIPKSRAWLTEILPLLDERRFRRNIRVSRSQFQVIFQKIANHEVFHGHNCTRQLPISTQLGLLLFRFGICGTGASISKISTFFGIGDGGTIEKITKRVMRVRTYNIDLNP